MPIFNPNGNEVSEIVLPNGNTAKELIAPDGSVVFRDISISDSVIYQTESADTTTISEPEPYSMIAVAAFDNDESGDIWQATLSDGNDISLTDKNDFDLNAQSGSFADLAYGTVSESGLLVITNTFSSSNDSKIWVNQNLGGRDAINPPDLDGEFIADNAYSNTFEEVLVYDEDIDAAGHRTDEEQRLAYKYNITL